MAKQTRNLREDLLIAEVSIGADELMKTHPPVFHNANKQLLYSEFSGAANAQHCGTITCTRWKALVLPQILRAASKGFEMQCVQQPFTYQEQKQKQQQDGLQKQQDVLQDGLQDVLQKQQHKQQDGLHDALQKQKDVLQDVHQNGLLHDVLQKQQKHKDGQQDGQQDVLQNGQQQDVLQKQHQQQQYRLTVEWHLNFAHRQLFIAYGGPLFAQDEIQVAEHVALGALRRWMLEQSMADSRYMPVTVQGSSPTPVLVRNVERRISIALDANAEQGRPEGIYGNRFARASPDTIRNAVTLLDPPTLTKIIAIEAPCNGCGLYDLQTVEFVLQTAYSGFIAAVLESRVSTANEHVKTVIHTGAW